MNKNIILLCDSYKLTQSNQYPSGMKYMHDYLESRGGSYGYTKFFGLQYYLKKYLTTKITKEMVDEAFEFAKEHGITFNYDGWMYIVNELNGNIPVKIRAVKEGAIIPNHNVLVTIESTSSKVPWIVTWVETLLLKIWYPITVATFSYKMKKLIKNGLEKTSDNVAEELPFKLHDFGFRGVSSNESAMIGGMAHLVNFQGTDTIYGVLGLKQYYNSVKMGGYSIPASEHSTTTSWGKDHELEAYENMLLKFENQPVSIVLDSYDLFYAINQFICKDLKEQIIKRKYPVIIRLDSGDAAMNIMYTLRKCAETFGYKINQKGYKVLNHIRILQGDGVTEDLVYDIIKLMIAEGYAIDNLAFGCGGALLQGNKESSINRDTHKFAIKCSAIIDHENNLIEVYKDPITDKGKTSKKGRLDLILDENNYPTTVVINDLPINQYHPKSILEVVYENGKIMREQTIEEIRQNDNLYKY